MAHGKTVNNRRERTLEVLCGGKKPAKEHELTLMIAEAIDEPMRIPYLIEEIAKHKDISNFRFHLVRAQLESELKMREDVDFHSTRLWVAQMIEKITFGDLLAEGVEDGVLKKEKKGKKKK